MTMILVFMWNIVIRAQMYLEPTGGWYSVKDYSEYATSSPQDYEKVVGKVYYNFSERFDRDDVRFQYGYDGVTLMKMLKAKARLEYPNLKEFKIRNVCYLTALTSVYNSVLIKIRNIENISFKNRNIHSVS